MSASQASPASATDAGQLCTPQGGVSDELKVTGWVGEERTYDADALAELDQTTVADTFLSGSGSTSRNYTGVELWRLLELPTSNGLGPLILPNDPPGPQKPSQGNDITRYSVMVTGTDCFQALFAMTEISPFFGGKPVVVATAQGDYDPQDLTPVEESLGTSGFARISNPADKRGSRRVSNIAEIRVLKAPATSSDPPASAPTCDGGTSDELTITGAVTEERTFDLEALRAEEQTTVADTYLSGGGSTSRNYTGVELWRLLGLSEANGGIGSYITTGAPGPQFPAPQRNDLTRHSVMVTATDCFQALFSLAEISPFFGGNPVLVATAQGAYDPDNLSEVTDPLGGSGFARISVPVDQRGSRRISNIAEIKVIPAPTPEVAWEKPVAIVAGTPLGNAQLGAAASLDGEEVPGVFHYDPAAEAVLDVGEHELTGLFVPDSPSSVTIARGAVPLTVADVAPIVTISATRDVIKATKPTVLSAALTADGAPRRDQPVQLLHRPHGASAFTLVETAVTDDEGIATVTVQPLVRTAYQWRFPGSTELPAAKSTRQAVKVMTKLTLAVEAKPRKLVAKGTTTPAKPGAKVVLWQQKKSGAVRLASGKVLRNGKAKVTRKLSPGTYRVFMTVAAGGGNAKGTSPVRAVTVKKR